MAEQDLTDLETKSKLLDVQGHLERAAACARDIDLRHVRKAGTKKLVNDLRLTPPKLIERIKHAAL